MVYINDSCVVWQVTVFFCYSHLFSVNIHVFFTLVFYWKFLLEVVIGDFFLILTTKSFIWNFISVHCGPSLEIEYHLLNVSLLFRFAMTKYQIVLIVQSFNIIFYLGSEGTGESSRGSQAEHNWIQKIFGILQFHQGESSFFIFYFPHYIVLIHFDSIFFYLQPNSQWRKVQDRLEVDERCSRLEKIDQLEIFQVISLIRNYLPIPHSANFNCCTGVSAWSWERRRGETEDTEGT